MEVFGSIPNPFGTFTLSQLLNNTISLAFIVALILVFFFLIFGGIKWIISGGDQKQTEAARNMITAAIVGLAIVALAYALTLILETFFGVKIFGGVDIPTAQQGTSGRQSTEPRNYNPWRVGDEVMVDGRRTKITEVDGALIKVEGNDYWFGYSYAKPVGEPPQ